MSGIKETQMVKEVWQAQEELEKEVKKSAEEIVEGILECMDLGEKAQARMALRLMALRMGHPDRFLYEVREGRIAEEAFERIGTGRLIAMANLAAAGADVIASEDEEIWALFLGALLAKPSSGLDRSAMIRNAVRAWRNAMIERKEEEARALREELAALLIAWRDLSYREFRDSTRLRPDYAQEAETYVAHEPWRASYQIFPIGPSGVRDERPIRIVLTWEKPEHEAIARRLIGLLERFAMDLGNVSFDPGGS